MELYLTDLVDPTVFLNRKLPEAFHARVNEGAEPLIYGGMFDRVIFKQFLNQFNCISISSGIPRNDYGQTVKFLRAGNPKVDENVMEWKAIPPHLISEGLSLKPTEMSGRYGYRRVEDGRGHTLVVGEFFLFEFCPEYRPETFSQLSSSLAALRYLSSILHRLDTFTVTLLEGGVHVSLRARIADSYKLSFAMSS